MKVKILTYCQEMIDGRLLVLDANKIIDLEHGDAQRLIDKGIATEDMRQLSLENKMLNIIYKKRGRPRKEV